MCFLEEDAFWFSFFITGFIVAPWIHVLHHVSVCHYGSDFCDPNEGSHMG